MTPNLLPHFGLDKGGFDGTAWYGKARKIPRFFWVMAARRVYGAAYSLARWASPICANAESASIAGSRAEGVARRVSTQRAKLFSRAIRRADDLVRRLGRDHFGFDRVETQGPQFQSAHLLNNGDNLEVTRSRRSWSTGTLSANTGRR